MLRYETNPNDLRESLLHIANDVRTTNDQQSDRYNSLVEFMREQALVFRDVMLGHAAFNDTAISSGIEYPIWYITKDRYGGGSLNQRDRNGNARDRRRLVIQNSGEFALAYWDARTARWMNRAFIEPQGSEQLNAQEFINRKAANTELAAAEARDKFIADLETATVHYMQEPFEPFKLT